MTRATSSTQVGNRTAKWSTNGRETADVHKSLKRQSGSQGLLVYFLPLWSSRISTKRLTAVSPLYSTSPYLIEEFAESIRHRCRKGSFAILHPQERYTKHDQRLGLFRSLPSNVEYGLFPGSLEPSIEVQRIRSVSARIRRLLAVKDIVRADVDQPEIQFGS